MRLVAALALACAGPDGGGGPKDGTTPPDTDTDPIGDPDTDTDAVPSADATLAALDVGAPLSPAFDPEVGFYAVRASALPDPVAVVATPTDAGAAVAITLETVDGADVATGTELAPLADHRVLVEVTSADGTTTRRYAVGLLPDDFPEVEVVRSGEPAPGWILLTSFVFGQRPPGVADHLVAIDGRGTPGWWRRAPDGGPVNDLRVGRDGLLTYVGPIPVAEEPAAVTFDAAYDASWIEAADVAPYEDVRTNIHEHDRLADGGALVLGDFSRVEDLTAYGGGAAVEVLHTLVQELDPAGAVRFSWSTVGVIDYADLNVGPAARWEPFHVNSVEHDPADGHLVVSLRWPSQVLKLARHDDVVGGRAVAAGEVIWRLGGPGSDFVFVGDPRGAGTTGFSTQHSARMTGPDTIAVFDNAVNFQLGPTGAARFVEYRLDTVAWTATRLAEHPSSTGETSFAAGSVQRLGNGGTLIGWGTLDPPGEDVTELDAAGGIVLTVTFQGDLSSYRAWKVEGDPLTGTWIPPY